nr:hypothetical protein [Tanacetum cinerariifolium]
SRLAKIRVESSVVNRDCVEFLGTCNGLFVLASLRDLRWFDDYKVVSISSYRYFAPPYKSFFCVFVDEFLHWIVNTFFKRGIVTFSLADEKFSELPSSSLYANDVDIMFDINSKLVALGEKLAIFHAMKGVVWLMNEYGVKESWTKIIVPGFNEIPMNKPEIFYDNRKLLFVCRNIMWIYDLKEGTFCETADIFDMHLWRVKCAYVESLVSPKIANPITDHQFLANNINA